MFDPKELRRGASPVQWSEPHDSGDAPGQHGGLQIEA